MATWLLGAAKLLLAMQATEAVIVGTVRDGESGEPVVGAVMTLAGTGRVALSDSLGRYAIRSLAGSQRLAVRRIGYASRTFRAFVPRDGVLEINVVLRADPLRLRTMDVRPPVAVSGGDEAIDRRALDRGMSLLALRHHPLLAEPDALLALGGGDVVLRAESPSGLHLRGGASDQTGYLLDGVPVFSPYHTAGTFGAWNPDALDRVDLSLAPRPNASADALSGTVEASTRTPGPRITGQGSLTTTQARVTVDGPLGAGAGYMASIRSGFPGFIVPEREPSYLRGESGDLFAKVEMPMLGGRGRVLVYDNTNELAAAARASLPDVTIDGAQSPRHAFEWRSRSAGAGWTGAIGATVARLQLWSASGAADALWNVDVDSSVALTAERRDIGVVATAELATGGNTTVVSLRARQSRTRYHAASADASIQALRLAARTPLASLFVAHQRTVATHLTANVGVSATAVSGSSYLGPQALLRWQPLTTLAVSTSYARSHQFAQSLRNAESILATVFPPDLFIGASAPGVPVGRADNAVLAAELRPIERARLDARVYARKSIGLVLVAPRAGEPFAVDRFTTGAGESRGFSLDATVSDEWYGLLASYGLQRVRLAYADTVFSPDHAATHRVDAGAIVFPSMTSSIRVGVAAEFGRRGSGLYGNVESEGCNLLDRGCEMAGTPRVVTNHLGGTRLPAYFRVDVGARRRWDVAIARRRAMVAVFGTVTNVFGRRNVLAIISDRSTGLDADIGMRPLAPLVVGIDWRF